MFSHLTTEKAKIQILHQKMDKQQGRLDIQTDKAARKALGDLSDSNISNSTNKIMMISLASRISSQPQTEQSTEATHVYEKFFKKTDTIRNDLFKGALSQVPPKERQSLCLQAMLFINNDTNGSDTVAVLEKLSTIPASEREQFYLITKEFIDKNSITQGLYSILNTIISVPIHEISSVFQEAEPFLSKRTSGSEAGKILKILLEIPIEKKEDFCSIAKIFLDNNLIDLEISFVLDELAEIPMEDWNDVLSTADYLITPQLSGSDVAYILNQVQKIPKEDIEQTTRILDSFPDEWTNFSLKLWILTTLLSFPIEDRESVFEAARPFIPGYLNQENAISILEILAEMPIEERFSVSLAAEPFIKEETYTDEEGEVFHTSNASSILSAVVAIPSEQRETACLITERCSNYFESPSEAILGILEKIPNVSKDRFFQTIKKTTEYGNKSIVTSLLRILLKNNINENFIKAHIRLADQPMKIPKILPSIIPAKWIAEIKKGDIPLSVDDQKILDKAIDDLTIFFSNKQTRKAFKHDSSRLMQPYLLTSLALDKTSILTSLRKLQLFSSICNQKDLIKGLAITRALCLRKEEESLRDLSLENITLKLTEALQNSLAYDEFIKLDDIPNFVDKYLTFFADTRVPFALETYATGLRNLHSKPVRDTLNLFVRSVLTGSFESKRYDISKNPHLQKIQEYDIRTRSNTLEQWKTLTFEPIEIATNESSDENQISFEKFFEDSLNHGHAIKDQENLLPDLLNFLSGNQDTRAEILDEIAQRIKIKEESSQSSLAGTYALKIDLAQKLCIELLLNPHLSKEAQLEKLQETENLLSSLEPQLEICNDLNALIDSLKSPQQKYSSEKVQLSKNWEDLFLSGSEVKHSCQRIDGNPALNKCLLAYCLDGKNAMIAVKGANGKILARSFLRLLWNKKESELEDKPVLFLDKLYPSDCPKGRADAIKEAAKECSIKLGLEIFESKEPAFASADEDVIIESLGSSCPYEYADGAKVEKGFAKVMPAGVFTIENPGLLS